MHPRDYMLPVPPPTVGASVWVRDGNRRAYDTNRRLVALHCWREMRVTRETSRTWYADEGNTHIGIAKADPLSVATLNGRRDLFALDRVVWSWQHAQQLAWCEQNRRMLAYKLPNGAWDALLWVHKFHVNGPDYDPRVVHKIAADAGILDALTPWPGYDGGGAP